MGETISSRCPFQEIILDNSNGQGSKDLKRILDTYSSSGEVCIKLSVASLCSCGTR